MTKEATVQSCPSKQLQTPRKESDTAGKEYQRATERNAPRKKQDPPGIKPEKQPRVVFLSREEQSEYIRRFMRREIHPDLPEAAELEKEIKVRQVGQVQHPDVKYAKEQVMARVVDAKTKTPRSGARDRHFRRGNFAFTLEPEVGVPLHVMDVYSNTGNSKLNIALQERLGAEGLYELLYILDPRVKSQEQQEKNDARHYAISVLQENAGAIWPNLWFSDANPIKTIQATMQRRKVLLSKFRTTEELDFLDQRITHAMNFPGWLAIEQNQKEIGLLAAGTRHRLTAEEVIQAIWPKLQSSAMKLRAKYEEAEAIRQQQEIAGLEAERKKNQTPLEQKRDMEAAQKELAAMKLRQEAGDINNPVTRQNIKEIVTRMRQEGLAHGPQQQQ